MGRRTGAIVFALCVYALVGTVGCADQRSLLRLGGGDESQVQVSASPSIDVLVWQDTPERAKRLNDIVESIDELNPDIDIVLSFSSDYAADLDAEFASGDPPDVFLLTGPQVSHMAGSDTIAPVPRDWVQSGQLLKPVADAITVDGVPYCFPLSVHTLGVVYNRALFDDAGRSHPDSDWTWEEFRQIGIQLNEADQGVQGIALDPDLSTWLPFYLQSGGLNPVGYADAGALSPAPAESASGYFARLFAEGVAVTPSELGVSWSGEALSDGKAVLIVAGDWVIPYLADRSPQLRLGTSELPEGPDGKATVAFVNCLAVAADSPVRDLALQLASQLTAPEVAKMWLGDDGLGLPMYAEPDVSSTSTPAEYGPYLRSLRYAQPWRIGPISGEQAARFAGAVEQVAAGDLAPDEFWPYVSRLGAIPDAP